MLVTARTYHVGGEQSLACSDDEPQGKDPVPPRSPNREWQSVDQLALEWEKLLVHVTF